jgi:hypothetical protein
MLLAGCGSSARVAASPLSSASTSSPASSSPAWPGPNGDLSTSVMVLRGGLQTAFASGRDGRPLRAAPSAVLAALKHYFATVDPASFNGASRVAFVWAFTMVREPDGHRSTSTRQYVAVSFWADGEQMVAAGSMAPGFNDQLMSLSKSSPSGVWHVDGLYYP